MDYQEAPLEEEEKFDPMKEINPENFDPKSEANHNEADREVKAFLENKRKAEKILEKRLLAAQRKEMKQKEVVEQIKEVRKIEEQKEEQKVVEFEKNLYKRETPKFEEDSFNKYLSEIFKTDLLSKTLKNLLEPKIFKTHEKYSEQEKEALVSAENFVLLGRSGTGKTLVAMTKMFLLNVCSNLKEPKAFLNDIAKGKFYMRMIFTTTSPNLVDEVAKYYMLMENKFKAAIVEVNENQGALMKQRKNNDENKKNNTILSLTAKEVKYNTFDELKVKYIFFSKFDHVYYKIGK